MPRFRPVFATAGLADPPPRFTALVSFGDSLSDEGNFTAPSAPARQTWVGQFADKLGIASFSPSGLTPPARGTNYAFAGAMTRHAVESGLGFGPPFDDHHLTVQISGRYLSPSFNPAGPRTDPATLHTLAIGGNDLLSAANLPPQIASDWATLDAEARLIARSAETQIAALARAGVRHLLWVNLADLSATPLARQVAARHGPRSGLYLEKLGHAVLVHNQELAEGIRRLRANPDHARLTVTLLDLHAGFRRLQAEPAAQADAPLFIDEIHPSYKAHGLIADAALQSLSNP